MVAEVADEEKDDLSRNHLKRMYEIVIMVGILGLWLLLQLVILPRLGFST